MSSHVNKRSVHTARVYYFFYKYPLEAFDHGALSM